MSNPPPYVKCPVCAGPAVFDPDAENTVYCLNAPPAGKPCGFMGMMNEAYLPLAPTDVKYPKGTPEYEKYASDLSNELASFAAGEPPYNTP